MPRYLSALVVLFLSVLAVSGQEIKRTPKEEAKIRFVALAEYCRNRQFSHIIELSTEWREYFNEEHRSEVIGRFSTFGMKLKKSKNIGNIRDIFRNSPSQK